MIGGSGPKKTLRTLARYGDQWNTIGRRSTELAERDAILRERCAEIGRDDAEIERTTTVDLVIRDTPRGGARRLQGDRLAPAARSSTRTGTAPSGRRPRSPTAIRPMLELGFRHVLIDTPAPYDPETLDRIGEVIELLNA